MNIWFAIVFGVVQGLTEFLPVSSSGHLLIIGSIMGTEVSPFLTILLHMATMIAIVLFYWNEIIDCIKHPFSKTTICLVAATICTFLIALPLSRFSFVSSAVALGPCFIVSGLIIIVSTIFKKKATNPQQLNYVSSLSVGILQGFCVLPGLSRLGTTASCLKMHGLENKDATKFSFLLAAPIVFGGMILSLFKGFKNVSVGVVPCLAGFFSAFIVSCFSLLLLKRLIKSNKWWVFAPYLIAIGIVTCIWQYA